MAAYKIFGFEIRKSGEMPALAPVVKNDGAIENEVSAAGASAYGYYLDLNKRLTNEIDLINKYRSMSQVAEIDAAIEDIVNEAIVVEENQPPVSISIRTDDGDIPEQIADAITEEFKNILILLDFHDNGHELFRQWYVDGKLYAQIVADESDLAAGIQDIRMLDPRKIKKVRDIIRQKNSGGADVVVGTEEYFVFNEQGTQSGGTGIKLSPDTVIYANSGLTDEYNSPISYLHKAIKPANQLRYMEDAALIYTLSRAPSRRVFYIDIADMPKQKADQYMQNIMAKYKNKVAYNTSDGTISDDRVHQCLAMDTKVPLLDGRTLTIAEIAEEYQHKQLWAYSCDPVTGKFAPGLITWAGVSRPNAQVLKITLDNGEEIIATPDHKFPVWNKNLVKAEDLVVGDSMIPLYRRNAQITKSRPAKYEQFFDNEKGKWTFTHRAVSKWKDSHDLVNEYVFNEDLRFEEKKTVHHINYNKLDNSPSNLIKMSHQDHVQYHHYTGTLGGNRGGKRSYEIGVGFHNKNHPDYHAWHVKAGKAGGRVSADTGKSQENFALGRSVFAELMNDAEFNAWFRQQQRDGWSDESKEVMSQHAKTTNLSARGNAAKKELFKTEAKQQQHREMYATAYSREMYDAVEAGVKLGLSKDKIAETMNSRNDLTEQFNAINSNKSISKEQKSYDSFTKHDVSRIVNLFKGISFKELRDQFKFRNHKIAKIEWLEDRIDTGCLTIDGEELFHNHHTFALAGGIYTSNSMLEDFWLPRRSNGRATEIQTLPSETISGQMDNVNYFLNKLYGALNIPLSRLKQDSGFSLGRTQEITRDEIKFSKFIDRLRKRFTAVFLQALRVQLILKGIITPEDWEFIRSRITFDYLRDNYFAELKETEILSNRLQMAEQVMPLVGTFYSMDFVRRKILRQTDEEIEEMQQQIAAQGGMPPQNKEE